MSKLLDTPTNLAELFERISRETARMSYPGSMSRGQNPIVKKNTKATLENYFAKQFPLREVWQDSSRLVTDYETWHHLQTDDIANAIGPLVCGPNKPTVVAAKFLDTFMHQLMKYGPCRSLWPKLHLPLDSRVFIALRKLRYDALSHVQHQFKKSAYILSYPEHCQVQEALWKLLEELNDKSIIHEEFKFTSRIELNWLLWV